MSRTIERVVAWSALALGLALAVLGGLNLINEGIAADAERRGPEGTFLHWPLFFVGLVLAAAGIFLIARSVLRTER
jgi:hypothetical protein